MTNNYVVSGSRAGIGSVVVRDTASGKTTMVAGVGVESDPKPLSVVKVNAYAVGSTGIALTKVNTYAIVSTGIAVQKITAYAVMISVAPIPMFRNISLQRNALAYQDENVDDDLTARSITKRRQGLVTTVAAAVRSPSVTFLTSGTTWTVPLDWDNNANTIEVIGGGAGGSKGQSAVSYDVSGGGGAYSKIFNLALTPGATVTIQVGSGSLGTTVIHTLAAAGGDTWFNGASLAASSVGAKGGSPGTFGIPATGGLGGQASAGIGTVKFSGGNGNVSGNNSGAGGGAAGRFGAGGIGASGNNAGTIGGIGGAGDNGAGGVGGTAAGGNGGNGMDYDLTHGSGGGGGGGQGIGGNGGLYGAGGGGGYVANTQGNGAQGLIVITYGQPIPFWNTRLQRNIAAYQDENVDDDYTARTITQRRQSLVTTWSTGSNLQVSKFVQYIVTGVPTNALMVGKMVQYVVLEAIPPQIRTITAQQQSSWDEIEQESENSRRILYRRLAASLPGVTAITVGASATGAAGTLTPNPTGVVSGIAASGSAQALSVEIDKSLLGVVATGGVGSPIPVTVIDGVSGAGIAGSVSFESKNSIAGVSATGTAQTISIELDIKLDGVAGTGETGVVITGVMLGGVGGNGVAAALVPEVDANLFGVNAHGVASTVVTGSVIDGVFGVGFANDVQKEIDAFIHGVFGTGIAQAVFAKLYISTVLREILDHDNASLQVGGLNRESLLTKHGVASIQVGSLIREAVTVNQDSLLAVGGVIREEVMIEIMALESSGIAREIIAADITSLLAAALIRETLVSDYGRGRTPTVLVVT